MGFAFAVGRMSVAAPEPASPVAPAAVVREVVRTAAPSVDGPADCEQKLGAATALLAAVERERVGTPSPFPADLPPQYRPEGFEAAIRDALSECPESGLKLAHVDCDEFPCMAFFSQPAGSYNHAADSLRTCEGWKTRFHEQGQANSRFMTDGGLAEWSSLTPRPEGADFDENASKRWKLRLDQGEAALMDAWGGRELSPIEKVDEQIAFWRELDNEEMIAEAQAKRARLVAAEQGAR